MKKAILAILGSLVLAAVAEAIVVFQTRLDPWKLAAFLVSFALLADVFVALTASTVTRQLRQWAAGSIAAALGMPFLLLVPYLIYAFGTGTFTWLGLAKLVGYIAVPVALLLPDRLRHTSSAGWRDYLAMLALGFPVAANWLTGVWMWPEDLYFFRPVYSVCIGVYAFVVVRNLEGVGYRLTWRKADLAEGMLHFVAFSAIGIPLGIALRFIQPHHGVASVVGFVGQFVGIYLTIAIPEELLFRGILQNFLVRSIKVKRHDMWGLAVASVIFGLSHLHHAPVPNWRYAILATLAGLFYGNCYRSRQRLSASAFTHAMVDTMWRFWFQAQP